MKSKVILFCVLLFFSKFVESIPHSEDHLRQIVNPPSNWEVEQIAQDAQYLDTEFTQTRNVYPLTIPAIKQDSTQGYYSSQERYNYDGYGYNKSPVESPSEKQLLGNYNTQADKRRLKSFSPRVESYPSQLGFNSQQFRNPNWRTQNQYTHYAPSEVLINDSERPMVNTVQEPYRGPVHYPQPKYVPSSNRRFYLPDRSAGQLRREKFKYPLAENARDGKYVANSAHRFVSSGPIPYEHFSEDEAGASEIKASSGQKYLQNPAAQSGIIYNEVPAVIADTLADQSENIKYLENYSSTSSNTAPSTSYDKGSPVDTRSSNVPVSYESYNNGQAAASNIKTKQTGGRRHTQSFVPQYGIIHKESPAVISTDTLEDQRKDISRSDLSNTAQITNYDGGSPAISSADNYSSGSRPSIVRVPYKMYVEAQAAASEVNPKPTGTERYVQNIAPQSRLMYNNDPAVIATDILADQFKKIKYEKSENYKSRSDSSFIAPITYKEDSSSVISAADTNTDSVPINPTPESIEKKAPFDISKILSDKPLARRYAHNYRPGSGSSNIARDDFNNGVPTVIPESIEEKSGENEFNYGAKEPVPVNTHSGPSPASTDTESDEPPHGSSSSIPSNTNLNHKPSSGITDLSLINLLSKTDIEKFIAGNTKRFLVIHPNKTVEYVDNIDTESHQNSKLRLVNTQPKNFRVSNGDGTQLPENVKDNPVDETNSKLTILPENHRSLKPWRPHTKQQANSLKPLTPLSKPLIPLVNQAGGDTPYKPLAYREYQPEENTYSKPLSPNIVHHYKSKDILVYQPADVNKSNPSFSDEDQSGNDKVSKKLPTTLSEHDIDSKLLRSHKKHRVHPNKSTLSRVNQLANVDNSNTSYPDENQPSDSDEPFHLYKIQPTDGNQLAIANNSKPQSLNKNRPGDENDSNSSSPGENLPADSRSNPSSSEENQPEDFNISNPSRPFKRQQKPKSLHAKQSEDEDTFPENNTGDDNISNSSSADENDSENYKKQSTDHLKPTAPVGSKTDENPGSTTVSQTTPNYTISSKPQVVKRHKHKHIHRKSTTSSPIGSSTTPSLEETSDDQIIAISTDNMSDVPPMSTSTTTSKPIETIGKSDTIKDDNNEQVHISANSSSGHLDSISDKVHSSTTTASPSSSTTLTDNTSSDKTTNEIVENNNIKTDDKVFESQLVKGINDIQAGNNAGDDNISNSSSQDENEPEDYIQSKPLRSYEKQSTDDTKPTAPIGNKTDENPGSTTVSQTTPNYTTSPKPQVAKRHKHEHIRPKSTTSSPTVASSTKPSLEETSDDQIIVISPIEPVTDNVSDVPPMSASTTTSKPIETIGKSDTFKDDNNEQVDISANSSSGHLDTISDKVHSSTTTASPSSSTTLTDNTSSDKTANEIVENSNIKTDDKAVESQLVKGINDIQAGNNAGDDNISNSSSQDENEPEDYIQSKPLRSYEKQSTDDTKPTAPIGNKTDDNPGSTTVPQTTPNYTTSPKPQVAKRHKHEHIRPESTTSSPTVASSTKPSLEETSDDQIIVISPIEPVTDNVSDVPPMSASTTTSKPIETIGKSDTFKDDNNEQVDISANSSSGHLDTISDKVHSSTTTASPSSSTTLTDNTSSDKTANEIVENSNIKTDDKAVESQLVKGINDIQAGNNTGDDNISNSSSPDENKPEDYKQSKPLRPYEKQSTDDSQPTAPIGSKTDENPGSTTVTQTTPNYTTSPKPQVAKRHKHEHIRPKSTTSSPTVASSTTPSLEESSENQIITISHTEQVTNNVSDVPPMSTSTTKPKPIETIGKSDTIKDDNNEQGDNSANSSSGHLDSISDKVHSSTTTASPSSSTSPTDNTSGDKTTKETVENSYIKTNDKAAESQLVKGKNDIRTVQSAVYSSSELLDTNTDVPAESDVYPPATRSPLVQKYINTGDASGDNTLELKIPETDVTITVSSNTDNDSEDDFITINVEVSESAGSSGNDKSLLINVDTDDHSDDESNTSLATAVGGQSSDCKKDHNDDDGKGKNFEIDMSKIQGEPTIWIRTTNQDFIEKLTDKNDTAFDVVYFFNMVSQPVIEREKETRFYCNGTVVITIKETTYPNKDDLTPNIEETVQTMQIEDYKRYGLE